MEEENSLDSIIGDNPGARPAPEEPPRDDAREEVHEPEIEAAPESADEAPVDDDGGEDLPEFMTAAYLEKNPEDPRRWSELRGQRNEFRDNARAAAAVAAASRAEAAALKAELESLRSAQAQQPAQPAPAPVEVPDPVEDPQGFREHVRAEALVVARNTQLDMYEERTIATHGKERVDAAFNKFQTLQASEPAVYSAVMSSPDPWASMMAEVARRELMSEIGSDPMAYKNRLMEEARAAAAAELSGSVETEKAAAVEEALTRRRAIPTSIAKAPGVGRSASSERVVWDGPPPLDSVLGSALDK